MMNNCSFIGRLVKDIELKYTPSQSEVCQFTLAVDKQLTKEQKEKYKAEGKDTCDFIDFEAWNVPAKYLHQYAKQGDTIAVTGRLEKKTYLNNNNEKKYITHIICRDVKIVSKKNENKSADTTNEYIKEDMPF